MSRYKKPTLIQDSDFGLQFCHGGPDAGYKRNLIIKEPLRVPAVYPANAECTEHSEHWISFV